MTPRKLRAVALIGISVATLLVVTTAYELPQLVPWVAVAGGQPVTTAPLETRYGDSISFAFLTPLAGWAAITDPTGRIFIFTTTDGASHWRQLAAVPAPGIGVPDLHVLDSRHMWVAGQLMSGLGVFVSSDGGANWKRVTLPGAPIVTAGFAAGGFGWAWLDAQSARLRTTADWGATWTRLPDPPIDFGTPHFRNSHEGWLDGFSPAYEVFSTSDGGLTWQQHVLAAPPFAIAGTGATGVNPIPPTSSLPSTVAVTLLPGHGVLVDMTGRCQDNTCALIPEAEWESFDLGSTWRLVPPPPGGRGYNDGAVSYQDDMNWWIIRQNNLYKTADGGQTWWIAADEIAFDHLSPHVLDSMHAWAQVDAFDHAQPNAQPSSAQELEMTSDGGLNWTAVPVPVPL